jgi:uncharacterized membrane protein YagU involved in acid resistance
MNQFQSLWSKASAELSEEKEEGQSSGGGEPATVKTAEAISQNLFQHELGGSEKKWAGPAVHYGFGTLMGAAYGLMAESIPEARAGFGSVYGAAVWLAADEFGVPAAGLSGPPQETPVSGHLQALASHIVYGFTVEFVRWATMKAIRDR